MLEKGIEKDLRSLHVSERVAEKSPGGIDISQEDLETIMYHLGAFSSSFLGT